MATKKISTGRAEQKALLKLSPFELKDKLISLAGRESNEKRCQICNAGEAIPTG